MKYTELVKVWDESRKEWQRYESVCAAVAAFIYSTLQRNLEIDDRLFKLINPDDNEDKIKNTLYSPVGAVKLIENGWAKFGLYLILQQSENTWPKKPLRFTCRVKVENQIVKFKFAEDDEEELLSLNLEAEDGSKIVKKFDVLMNHHIRESFKHWHKEGQDVSL